MDDEAQTSVCAIHVVVRGAQRHIGAAVRTRLRRKGMDDNIHWRIDMYDFTDNEQFSNLDCLIMQLGSCEAIVTSELLEGPHGKKINTVFDDHNVTASTCKKSLFRNTDTEVFSKLGGAVTHITNSAEIERPLGVLCLECLCAHLSLLEDEDNYGRYVFGFGSLSMHMKMDSAGAAAIHLLPRPDDPSPYASLFGVLNRCKTKMGKRLLDRWIRQPLLDEVEINRRLDIVEIFKESVVARNGLADGALRGIPDVDSIIARLQRPHADLSSVYKLYLFANALPRVISTLAELVTDTPDGHLTVMLVVLKEKVLYPLKSLDEKFDMFRKLVEHVIDFDLLPEFFVAPGHDPCLMELHDERIGIENEAKKLQQQANNSWGSFTDVKLEHNSQHGFIFRTTKGDDERQLRANNPKIEVISILKNGLHFTTSKLSSLGSRYMNVNAQYHKQQVDLVKNAVATARTYLPIVETACDIVAQLDVLVSFATVAALSPDAYVRPTLSPLTSRTRADMKAAEPVISDSTGGEEVSAHTSGSRQIVLKKARHPCVELMDGVNFICNDYDLQESTSNFQIITGPNMGGKSTYIRGLGCIVAMAQMGSFVPCEEAHISIVDSILARVGAGDSGQKGVSTFMAEMLEASVLLDTATPNSLIIIDELGRGTSTNDGFGIAWAIAEYICSEIDTFCLFASHFHELTGLSRKLPNVVNKHVTAFVENKEVVMLHNVLDGPCLESFGIHVAAMAGFPDHVIREAKRKSDELEDTDPDHVSMAAKYQRKYEALQEFAALPMETLHGQDLRDRVAAIVSIEDI